MSAECPITGKVCNIGDCTSGQPQCVGEADLIARQVTAEYRGRFLGAKVFGGEVPDFNHSNFNAAVNRVAQTYSLPESLFKQAVINRLPPDVVL